MNVPRSSPSLASLKLGFIRRFTVSVSDYKKQNHYDSLGITPKATQGDIKTAYYKLSKEYHPDLNEGDEFAAEKFRNITAAYEVLGNVNSRKVYDRGLLVGSYPHEDFVETGPAVDTYQHAPFYHHRNKPTSRKSQMGTTTNYNIDEWTRAHYSRTFEQRFKKRTEATYNRTDESYRQTELGRNLTTVSLVVVILVGCLFTYALDTQRKYDHPSSINDKPD